jgi:hypothetical protein
MSALSVVGESLVADGESGRGEWSYEVRNSGQDVGPLGLGHHRRFAGEWICEYSCIHGGTIRQLSSKEIGVAGHCGSHRLESIGQGTSLDVDRVNVTYLKRIVAVLEIQSVKRKDLAQDIGISAHWRVDHER